jgi:ferredoxin-fold anticodon binding domain-containing protein
MIIFLYFVIFAGPVQVICTVDCLAKVFYSCAIQILELKIVDPCVVPQIKPNNFNINRKDYSKNNKKMKLELEKINSTSKGCLLRKKRKYSLY